MGTFGVQSGPGVLVVDEDDPDVSAAVTPPSQSQDGKSSAVATYQESLDVQTGFVRPQAADSGGRMVLSDTDKWTLMLAEMRLQTFYLAEIAAGRVVGDELDDLRASFAAPDLLNTLS